MKLSDLPGLGYRTTWELSEGSYKVSPEVEKTYGKELLDQVNQQYGTTTAFATGEIVQKPTVGRIVHYTAVNVYLLDGVEASRNVAHASIVLEANYRAEGSTILHVLPALYLETVSDTEISSEMREPFMTTQIIPFSETPKPGHWSWPPR